ncbi:MAG: molybdopterin oxidoreductase family protein [Rickettsiales bacterium TMED254]|nr:molybdopterin oxidoreductase [Rickettsiales bacterium]RPF76990.1 MAG: molybdopterin oxidoreductase family protein [Rickettsiales bacterium TMED254]
MGEIKKKEYFGACPHDCPDTCAMIYEVQDDKLLSVKGNKDHPMTRGTLCVKVKDYEKRHYHPDRLKYPLKRVGKKGEGKFTQITWTEAINTITTKWKKIIEDNGPQAIVPYSYLGNQGLVHGLNGGDSFFNKMGATVTERTFCGEGSCTAWLTTIGPTAGVDPESYIHSKYIVIWACNSVSTNLHHWAIVQDAKKKGAKVVVIDSYKSRTAKLADWHIMPKPGTDGALAMAIINSIIQNDLVDIDYVKNYTNGFEELKKHSKTKTPGWASDITGVSKSDIEKLAYELATSQPAAIRIGVALERHHGGGQTIRAVTCIPALTGAWKHVGGGITQFPVWEHPYNFDVICRPDLVPEGTRVINALQIGRALIGETHNDIPIKSFMCWNANPVTQAPETEKIISGLKREDIFVVSAEHFISDTALYADIVLPASMGAEHEDIILSWGHLYLTYNEKSIEPPGEALPNYEIFRRLSKSMGYKEEQFSWSDTECLEHYIDWNAPACEGIDLNYLKNNGFARLNVGTKDNRAPHKEGNFPTASGKCEFLLKDVGNFIAGPFRQMYEGSQPGEKLPELPDYVPPRESKESNPELAKEFPLNIISPKSHAFLNSCYANMEEKIRVQGGQFVLMNKVDALHRDISDGTEVKVYNQRGSFQGTTKITDDVSPGVIVSSLGYWRQHNDSGTVNSISSAEFANMGHAPTFSDNLVEVKKLA